MSEAPPAIISLYPGTGFEKHVDAIIAGGELNYKAREGGSKREIEQGKRSRKCLDVLRRPQKADLRRSWQAVLFRSKH